MTAVDPSDDSLINLMREAMTLTDAPDHVIQRALALWKPRRDAAAAVVRSVLAVLRFDSANAPSLAFGTRADPPEGRQIVFTAEGRDIDLRILPATGGQSLWEVSGQVLGPDRAGAVALEGTAGRWRTELNALCEFRFAQVPEGRYTVTFELQGTAIVVPELSVRRVGTP